MCVCVCILIHTRTQRERERERFVRHLSILYSDSLHTALTIATQYFHIQLIPDELAFKRK